VTGTTATLSASGSAYRDLGDEALHEARVRGVHRHLHLIGAGLRIGCGRNFGHFRREGAAGIGVERDLRGIACLHAHDVAVRERGAHDPAAGRIADDEHGLSRSHLLVRLGELPQHDAVRRRLDARVSRVEERGPQLRLRDLVGRRQAFELFTRCDLVGEERLAAVEVARGLVGDSARLRDSGGDLVVRQRREELAGLHRRSLFDRDRADHAAGHERETHLVGRGQHADRAQRRRGGRLLDDCDAHRRRGLGRIRRRVFAAAREGEHGGERRQ
jgi:hypothetical protein